MWILFKSVARFFKKSKVLLIGLILLIFSASTIFTTLNSMSSNLYNSYDNLVSRGNLHDFVVNEKYTLGYSNYEYTKTENQNANNPEQSIIRVSIKPSVIIDSGTNLPTNQVSWTDSYLNFYNNLDNKSNFPILLNENIVDYAWDANVNPPSNIIPPPLGSSEDYFLQTILPQVEIEINSMKNQLTVVTQKYIETNFDIFLNTLAISYRRFNSIDINNTKQSIFYKLIETSSSYQIDNLVIYEGNTLTEPIDYNNEIFIPFINDTNLYSRKLLDLLSRVDWSQTSIDNEIKAAHVYFNYPINIGLNPYTIAPTEIPITTPNRQLIIRGLNQLKNIYDKKLFNMKGFRINFSIPGTIPISGVIEDFSSYESVVPPSFIDKQNKSIFPLEEWTKHLNDSQKDFQIWFNNIDNKFKYSIDETEYVILASGISPDFMYPIVSFDNPIPNYDKEAIVYANKNGYQRTVDAFRGNNQEQFIVGKFNQKNEANALLNQINIKAETDMSWPHGTRAAYLASDTNNTLSPTSLRLQFIPQIIDIVKTVTVFLSLFIWLLSIIISILVIKRFIETNKNSLGIMLANGFKKKEIVWSLTLFLMVPILLAIIIGFFLGLALQIPAMFIFTNLWTIPVSLTFFSPLYFTINVIIQGAFFLILSFIFSWYSLRGNIAELMKDETKYKLSKVSIFMKKPFLKTGIMNTFRASVAFSSIWRLLLLSFMSSLVMLSFSFVLATNNKFNEAANDTYKTRNYNYALKLITPSNEGGQYYAVPYNYSGMTLNSDVYFNTSLFSAGVPNDKPISQNYLTQTTYQDPKVNFTASQKQQIEEYGNYHLISAEDDEKGQQQNILYLQYKSQNKIMLDHFLGALGIGANPWQIVTKLMPNNQINHSNNSFRKILENIILDDITTTALGADAPKTYREHLISYTKISNLNYEESAQVFADRYDPTNIIYREFDGTKISLTINLFKKQIVLRPNFIQLFLDIFRDDKSNYYKNDQYNVMFRKIGIDPTDRPFTYVDFTFSKINSRNYETSVNDTIFGINKPNEGESNAVDLISQSGEIANEKLFLNDKNFSDNPNYVPDYIPIIVNAFAEKKYGLNVGSNFEIKPNNKTDRFINVNPSEYAIKFRVVDVIKSYQNSEFFISQNNANYILGLSRAYSTNGDFDYSKSGFNGVYSFQNSIPQITNGMSLYSPSGLYPAYDTFSKGNQELINLLNAKPLFPVNSSEINLDRAKAITGITASKADEFLDEIVKRYGGSSVYAVLNNVIDRDSSRAVFETLALTVSSIQISVMITIISITLIIVVLISTMIVFDSIKLASFLKCLGLNDRDNALSFLMIYAPVFFIGLLVAQPLIYLVNFIYVEVIFKQAAILLVVNLSFINILIPIFSILLVFFISFLLAWYKIRGTNLPQIIK